MRVLCLNAWGGRLHDRLIEYLIAADPDILCLQEIVHTPEAGRDWLVYGDQGIELPQRANLFQEVSLRALGLIELVTAHGYADTRTSLYKKPGRYADYMLVSSEVDIRAFSVVPEPEVSDHRALLLELA